MEYLVVETPDRVVGILPAVDARDRHRGVRSGIRPVGDRRQPGPDGQTELGRHIVRNGSLQRDRGAVGRDVQQVRGHTPARKQLDVLPDIFKEHEVAARIVFAGGLLSSWRSHKEGSGPAASDGPVEQPTQPPTVLTLHEVTNRGGLPWAGRPLGRLHDDIEVHRIVSGQGRLESQVPKRVEVYDGSGHDRRREDDAYDDRRQQLPVGQTASGDHRPC